MIQSMTGYGAGQHEEDGVSYALDIKSVNHRYLKLAIKLPESLQFAESVVEKLLRSRIARGAVTYALRIRTGGDAGVAAINVPAMQSYVDQMAQVRLPAGAQASIDLAAVASLPGVCQVVDADEEVRRHRLGIIEALTQRVLESLLSMRRDEGQALRADVLQVCDALRARLGEIADLAPTVIGEYHQRLKTRVEGLLKAGDFELEPEALAREVAVYADRCDISEELSRLSSHVEQFVEICSRNGPVGRTLDFLTQELLREANTIASKSNNVSIVRNVVELKRLIDRLKEQVQNAE